jgi:hypothetical protein
MDHLTTLWRTSRGCCLVSAAVALLIVLGSCLALGFGVARLTEAASGGGLDVMLVVDQSGSLWELEGVGTDPKMARMEAARLLASTLGVDGPLADYRLGVIYFGTAPTLIAPLTSLTQSVDGRTTVLEALSHPPQPMGWTDVNAALALAYEQLIGSPTSRPNHAKVVILFTDGRPQTAELTTPAADDASLAELRRWVRRFDDEGAAIYTVLLGNPITNADPQMNAVYRPLWTDLAAASMSVRVYDVQAGDDLLDVYHELAVQLQNGQSQGAIVDQVVQGEALTPIEIEDGWERATFVVRKSTPSMVVTLLRPNGRVVQANDPDLRQHDSNTGRVEVWSVDSPQPGRWSIQASGSGVVTVWLDYRVLPPTPTVTDTATATETATPTRTPSPSATPTASPTATSTLGPTPTGTTLAALVNETLPPSPEPVGVKPPWGWLALAGATILVAGGGLGAISSRRRQPAVEGKLRLVHAPAGEPSGRAWDLGESGKATVALGGSRDCPIALTGDPTLLPKMALIRAERGADGQIIPWLIDLSGTGAAQVKGKPRTTRQTLADGDVIELGAYQLRYENLSLHRNAQAWRPPAGRGWSK